MIIGETLKESTTVRYSPWFDRQGNAAGFSCRAIAVSSPLLLLLVTVQTKNRTDSDGGAGDVATLPNIQAVGAFVAQGTGLQELVRYKYLVGSDPISGSEWVHFEMLDPIWREN